MAPGRDAPQDPPRFYARADAAPADGGFAVRLDGRVPRSPGGAPIVLPTRALADLVAAEWAAQSGTIVYSAMPATRLAWRALDGAEAREETISSIVRYAGADLLCYPASGPRALVARQEAVWTPLLSWARGDLGLDFGQSRGILHHAQPPETLSRLEALAGEMDAFILAGVAFAAALFGSAIVALALWRGRLDGAQAIAASRIDEEFQQAQWGVDPEAAARERDLGGEAAMLRAWFAAVR
ncbi:MAG: ATP12 family chaperone protein [Caulobacteraceae bacterium]